MRHDIIAKLAAVIAGIGLVAASFAMAIPSYGATITVSGMEWVNSLRIDTGVEIQRVYKVYDHDNGVVCYISDGHRSGGISCLNN